MTKVELIQSIHDAFHGVKLGNGIGLWEARWHDDYSGPLELKENIKKYYDVLGFADVLDVEAGKQAPNIIEDTFLGPAAAVDGYNECQEYPNELDVHS